MSEPKVRFSYVGNVYVREMHFLKKGDIAHGHSHDYDHLSLLSKGSLKLTINGQTTEYKSPEMIYIKKNLEHELEALEDDSVTYCIHAQRDETGDILSMDQIPKGVDHPMKWIT
jgi:quercetin dioxygenase-like cupin family protein